MNASVKNILFDLGGVLIDIDYEKTIRSFRTIGFPHFEQMFSQLTADELFQKLETGKILPKDFYKVMLSIARTGVTEDEIRDAWNSMLLEFRKESVLFLKLLSAQYDLYLLSNTNQIHYDAFTEMLLTETGYNSLEPLFKKAYFSHRIGRRKPNADSYEFVINDAGILPEETLFIDDTLMNIEAARKLGFHTHLLKPEERIEKILG
jgi:putative hydrolase of the HAD superfamily